MIHTLTSNLALYHISRNRDAMLTQMEKRKAVIYTSGITAAVTISAILWLIYR